jgi:hypothetical protein
MLNKVSKYFKKQVKLWQLFSVTGVMTLCLTINFNAFALEGSLQMHKGDQSGTSGYSIGFNENIFSSDSFYWGVNYNTLDKVNVDWNNETLNFELDTLDVMVSYRYSTEPSGQSRRRSNTIYTFEFQVGAGIALTENKFNWPSLGEEKIFSEKNDANAFGALLIHRSLSRNSSVHIGVKHYPEYSEFGDLSSVFLGFKYHFGQQSRYRN